MIIDDLDPLLHPEEVVKLLGFTRQQLAKARCDGFLPGEIPGPKFTKFGRAVRYPLSEVKKTLKQLTFYQSTSEQTMASGADR